MSRAIGGVGGSPPKGYCADLGDTGPPQTVRAERRVVAAVGIALVLTLYYWRRAVPQGRMPVQET